MKNIFLTAALCLVLFSCSKDNNLEPAPTPTPTVNNGPIGGSYNFTGLTTRSYDTIPGNGMVTINEYTTTSANLKGTIAITATAMNSKGLMYDFTTTGVKTEVNTSNGATVTTNMTPSTGSRGQSTSSVSSNYTINTTGGELTIDEAQYLFNPAFISQPGSKKHKYTVNGNVLKVVTEHYDPSTKYRVVNEATFTKQ